MIDFGEAFLEDNAPATLRTPLSVRPPEVIFEDRLNQRVDLWSAGCLIFELVTGQPLFDEIMTTPPELVQQMLEFDRNGLPLRWQKKWQWMEAGIRPQEPMYTSQQWPEEVYFDNDREKGFTPVDLVQVGKAEAQDRRNEKLARKNPGRIQKQIDDLKAITTNGGKLTRHEEQMLEGLEKELKVVNKAREALGDKAPSLNRSWNHDHDRDRDSRTGMLGKRRRGSNASSSDGDVPEDVRRIPMPRDTPPPIPKEVLDKWFAKRRARRDAENVARRDQDAETSKAATPAVETKTVYEAKPVIRDLRKEAVSAFVPTSVKLKMDKGQGQGGLLEPEEADRLEREGYMKTGKSNSQNTSRAEPSRTVTMEEVDDEEE
ncbi:Dual specificity tyrosine-phosphorylation-regulated kinase 4 [Paramyrothecium foliicola]|nr:Dual specificity tyrosine-phosphorylation-regulated kinase 4 [Paramyrothecium foliicola]